MGKKPVEYNVKCLLKQRPTMTKEQLQKQSNHIEMHQRSKNIKVSLPTVKFLEKKE
jgi:hypothetical protein